MRWRVRGRDGWVGPGRAGRPFFARDGAHAGQAWAIVPAVVNERLGVLISAIAALFGLDSGLFFADDFTTGDGFGYNFEFNVRANALSTLLSLVYFTYFHATSAGQPTGNKILGIRVVDAGSGAPLSYVRALMSYVSALTLPPRLLLDAVGQAHADLA